MNYRSSSDVLSLEQRDPRAVHGYKLFLFKLVGLPPCTIDRRRSDSDYKFAIDVKKLNSCSGQVSFFLLSSVTKVVGSVESRRFPGTSYTG